MLTDDVKTLMAHLMSPNDIKYYEFCFDERDKAFKLRLFIRENVYFSILLKDGDNKITVREYQVNKSYYHPSEKVHYINKYFKKFRDGYNYSATMTIEDFLKALPKIKIDLDNLDFEYKRDSYYGWQDIRRATTLY